MNFIQPVLLVWSCMVFAGIAVGLSTKSLTDSLDFIGGSSCGAMVMVAIVYLRNCKQPATEDPDTALSVAERCNRCPS